MKIVFLDANSIGKDIDLSKYHKLGEFITYGHSTAEQIPERVSDADIVITNKCQINEQSIGNAHNLKLVCVTATGTNNLDKEYLAKRNITWKNVAGYSTESVAQHTFALLFFLMEKLRYYDEYVKEKNTKIEEMKKILGKPEENPIIIFGCGNFGVYAYRWADNEGYHIKAFMDNDSSKWDKAIDNVIILSPEKIRNQEKNTKYIVANNLHWLDIKNQISEFGISEENISVF